MQMAVEAVAAGNDEGHHHAIADGDAGHRRTRLDDFAHKFMAEYLAMLGTGDLAAIEVQVRAANRRGRHAQDNIVRLLQNRIGNGLNAYPVRAMIGQSSHNNILS